MRTSFYALTFVVFCLIGPTLANGQAKVDEEFSKLQIQSQRIRQSRAHRVTATTAVFDRDGKKLKYTATAVIERLPTGESRTVESSNESGEMQRYETIFVGDKVYTKKGQSGWKVVDVSRFSGLGSGVGSRGIESLGEAQLDGRPVRIFRMKFSAYFSGESQEVSVKYWFASDGGLLRKEEDMVGKKSGEVRRTFKVYKFDDKIKIVAPIK